MLVYLRAEEVIRLAIQQQISDPRAMKICKR